MSGREDLSKKRDAALRDIAFLERDLSSQQSYMAANMSLPFSAAGARAAYSRAEAALRGARARLRSAERKLGYLS